ncbi:hypothetical protein Syun_001183 [Stephania yunnanensis]|uniref:Uncharacterized protein n=1 Tax=Stephania yunnanensis TaxID=152371 RepID=A0AAP0Q6V3_9MAGN
MWETSMKGLVSLIRKSTLSSFTYICEKNEDCLFDKMDELACFAPGMLALGSLGYGPGDREKMLTLAEEAKLQRRRQELTQTTPNQPVYDEAEYYNVAGECPKGRVYSIRLLGRKKRRYVDPYASTSQVLAQRGMGNFMILSTPKELLEGVQGMEQILLLFSILEVSEN